MQIVRLVRELVLLFSLVNSVHFPRRKFERVLVTVPADNATFNFVDSMFFYVN